MTQTTHTKKALIMSIFSLLLCCSMLLGTTFAWFTDSVSSANNIIKAGNLDIEMYWAEGTDDPAVATWHDASKGAIFNNDKWEPGYTEVRHIKIANVGSLALQYKVTFVANGEVTKLADVIDVYYVDPAVQVASRDALANAPKLGTLTEVLASLGETGTGYLASGENDTITLALKMREDAGNEYQGLGLCDGGFSVQLLATQATGEFDSFGDDYDNNAAADFFPGFQGGSGGIAVPLDEQRYTTEEVTVDFGDVTVVIPVGVKLAEGFTSLTASVVTKNASESNVQLNETEKMRPSDVHIEGVAEDNAIAMLITLKHYLTTGLNSGALRLYHVENGATVAMTQVATPVNHNEFSYDPATGDVTLALASFSEVAVVADTNNTWDGTAATAFAGGTGTEADPYQIANADQLAYFRTQVDNGNTFEGKFVKLNNNISLSKVNFDPIGWGYENKNWNVGGVAGKPFKGTFDGNDKTIYDLYQSGWDLTNAVTGEAYTYTNCGFGLFAAAADATFKNLTIYGADIRVECVETGILVGLSQGSCTYENIIIQNSKIANYQRPTGGLIGEVSPLNGGGETKITGVKIGSDVVVGSLWGDFDAPCGGVIGARWDDTDTTKVYMKNVEVGCRMDVYNDITSAYQWHAYRRAGMLIGNTEQTAENNQHLAAARFLTCENVTVLYGAWVNYTYCEFNNHNSRYPWVRTQAGENCTAFSNPRWGVPNDVNGKLVTDMDHKHQEGDECGVLRQFSQLYGGGQGVYGADEHPGVTTDDYAYSITYMNDYKVLDIVYVTNNKNAFSTKNDQAQKLVEAWATENLKEVKWQFGGWMNAGSTKLTQIDANNTKNIVLYPYFNNPYTARFVDQQGNVIAYCLFHKDDLTQLDATKDAAQSLLPAPGANFAFDYWEVNANGTKVQYSKNNFADYGYDVTIYPVYRYTGNLKLTPVDEDSDGTIDYYKVEAVDKLDETTVIPGYVNGIPVKLVEKLYNNDNTFDYGAGVKTVIVEEGVAELKANSLSYTNDLTRVELPSTLTKLGKNTFSRNLWYNILGDKDTKKLQIVYNGTKADWDKVVANSDSEWANGLKKGTTVKCTDGTYTVTSVNLETSNHKWSWTPN